MRSVIFDGGGSYRFGSPYDGAADALLCSGILPLTTDPAGATCDIEECAALLDLTVRFDGDPADLAAIEPLPVTCRAWVTNFEDPWGSGETQAESEYYLFDPQDLMSPDGVQMELLARSSSQPVTVTDGGGGITLSAVGYKVKGVQHADLTWSGATTANVDVYRDGVLIVTTPNDGFETDNIGNKGGGTYVYEVCES